MAKAVGQAEFLNERRMKAADALLHHGECLDVAFVYADGARRMCRLAGRGEQEGTVILSVWSLGNQVQSKRPVRFEEVALYPDVATRLDAVARAQEATPEEQASERARAEAWAQAMAERKAAKTRGRWANGQFRTTATARR